MRETLQESSEKTTTKDRIMFWRKQKSSDNAAQNEFFNEILQTKGLHRDLLEVQNIKANTKLAERTLQNLKYQNITNLIYLLIGAFIPIIYSSFFSTEDKRIKELQKENKSIVSKYEKYIYQNETVVKKLESEIHILKDKK